MKRDNFLRLQSLAFLFITLLLVGCVASRVSETQSGANPAVTLPSSPPRPEPTQSLIATEHLATGEAKATASPALASITPTLPTSTMTAPADEVTLKLLGQIGGMLHLLALRDNEAYLGIGPRLAVVDVSDPSASLLVGQSDILPDLVQNLALVDNHAYLATGSGGLWVLDVTTPDIMPVIGSLDTPGNAMDVAVAGNHAYIADEASGLQVIDISNPALPHQVGSVDTSGRATSLIIQGNYIYLVDQEDPDGSGGIRVIEIAQTAMPRLVGSLDVSYISSTAIAGGYAYLVTYDANTNVANLQVIQISDPTNPQKVAELELPTPLPDRITLSENYAYVSGGYCDLGVCPESSVVVDVSDPAKPYIVSDSPPQSTSSTNHGILKDNLLYAINGSRLEISELTDLSSPSLLGQLELVGPVNYVAAGELYAYVLGSDRLLHAIDVRDITNPVKINSLPVPQYCTGCVSQVTALETTDNSAYLSLWNDGLLIVDVSEPSQPHTAAHLNLEGDLHDLVAVNEFVYVVGWLESATLHVVNTTEPTQPHVEATIRLDGVGYWRLALAGNQLYVVNGSCGEERCQGNLQVIDIIQPALPERVGTLDVPGAVDVAVSGDYAYVASELCYYTYASCSAELWIIDITDPAQPHAVGTLISDAELPRQVAAAAGYVYWGSQIVDVTDPTQPRVVGASHLLSGNVNVTNDRVYVAGGDKGLLILGRDR